MTRADLLSALVARALFDDERLPITERANLYDAAAIAFEQVDRAQSELARHTAELLREADRHQLKFRELLRS